MAPGDCTNGITPAASPVKRRAAFSITSTAADEARRITVPSSPTSRPYPSRRTPKLSEDDWGDPAAEAVGRDGDPAALPQRNEIGRARVNRVGGLDDERGFLLVLDDLPLRRLRSSS